jgi:glycosyltransferase involved in cell wall biosynthesis
MDATKGAVEVSVIVPARNEEASLAACLGSLAGQRPVSYEIIVVDDHSTDRTRAIAEQFGVTVLEADPLPSGWSGKCNACWAGARAAQGKWLLFTDADTKHSPVSIVAGLREAQEHDAALLSYSPKQDVHSLAEHALMPLIFAELAVTFRPKEVSDPASPAAAANGQYLLVRRDAYDAVGGHAAIAKAILEDVELAKRVKAAGYGLQFRYGEVVRTRMYRTFPQLWEGWTKNLALLFPKAKTVAYRRATEFSVMWGLLLLAEEMALLRHPGMTIGSAVLAMLVWLNFIRRIAKAHSGWFNSLLAVFGLPMFSWLLLRSVAAHRHHSIWWKGREYSGLELAEDGETSGSVVGTGSRGSSDRAK